MAMRRFDSRCGFAARWAKKIWEDFLHHVQEEQNAFRLSSDSKGIVEAQPLAVRDLQVGVSLLIESYVSSNLERETSYR